MSPAAAAGGMYVAGRGRGRDEGPSVPVGQVYEVGRTGSVHKGTVELENRCTVGLYVPLQTGGLEGRKQREGGAHRRSPPRLLGPARTTARTSSTSMS